MDDGGSVDFDWGREAHFFAAVQELSLWMKGLRAQANVGSMICE